MRLFLLALAWAGGAGWLQQQAQLPPPAGVLVLVIPVLMACWLATGKTVFRRRVSFALWILIFFLGGFFWAGIRADLTMASRLGEHWYGRDVRVQGVIAQLTQPGDRGTRFVMDIERILTVGATVPRRVSITWYGEWGAGRKGIPDLRAGQRWQMVVRLRPPHGTSNPHGFDFQAWLLERGIRATGYVRDRPSARLVTPMVWRPGYVVQRLREKIRQNLLELLDGRPYGGIIVALAVGDQRAITQSQWRVLTRTGTNHLVSISGLHITLVAGLMFAVVLRLWRRSAWLAARVSPLRAATLFGLIAAVLYAALAGFAIPAQRAVCMLAVVAVLLFNGWRWPAPAILGTALLFVLLLDPMAVGSPGFWLSFGAVATILLVGTTGAQRDSLVRRWTRLQWSISLALIPLLLVLFQKVSVIAPVANLFAIPLVSLCVAPLALMQVVVPFGPLAALAHEAVRLVFVALEWLSVLPGAVWQQHAPVTWTLPFGVLGVVLMLLPRGFPARWTGIVLVLPMFVVRPAAPAPGQLWLTVLDVGQGLAVVARTANHTVLFDTGPDYQGWSDAGRRIVAPYLRGEGVSVIDLLVISHDDLDHSGGAASLLAQFDVRQVISPQRGNVFGSTSRDNAIRCHAGQSWQFDQVKFEILYPEAQTVARSSGGDNDRSCVLRVESGHGVVLLPADIERRSEQFLVDTAKSRLAADMLVAPHHGSKTSSSGQFVSAVGARLVVFPVGYANRYGHPHPVVAERYRAAGAVQMRTDRTGAVIVKFGPEGMSVSAWRNTRRRYWNEMTY